MSKETSTNIYSYDIVFFAIKRERERERESACCIVVCPTTWFHNHGNQKDIQFTT